MPAHRYQSVFVTDIRIEFCMPPEGDRLSNLLATSVDGGTSWVNLKKSANQQGRFMWSCSPAIHVERDLILQPRYCHSEGGFLRPKPGESIEVSAIELLDLCNDSHDNRAEWRGDCETFEVFVSAMSTRQRPRESATLRPSSKLHQLPAPRPDSLSIRPSVDSRHSTITDLGTKDVDENPPRVPDPSPALLGPITRSQRRNLPAPIPFQSLAPGKRHKIYCGNLTREQRAFCRIYDGYSDFSRFTISCMRNISESQVRVACSNVMGDKVEEDFDFVHEDVREKFQGRAPKKICKKEHLRGTDKP